MCRVFGFRSILKSGVHSSLLDSDNAIIQQSDRHPDGWGVAYYHMGSPHLVKNENQAKQCKIFEKVSGVVSSNTVIAHIRKSTIGSVGPLNTHPFQFGPWVFAHNGNVKDYAVKKESWLKKIDPELRRFILGETDSEALFFFLMTLVKQKGFLQKDQLVHDFKPILQEFVDEFQNHFGPLKESKGDYDQNYLTFLISDGQGLFTFHGGQPLYFSTHKGQCSERQTCSYFRPICEKQAQPQDKVHHFLVSSEVIKKREYLEPIRVWGVCWREPRFYL
jgi:hypothetical protein